MRIEDADSGIKGGDAWIESQSTKMSSKLIIIAAIATLVQGFPLASSPWGTSSNVQLAFEKSIEYWTKAVNDVFETIKGSPSSEAEAVYEADLADGAEPYLWITSANYDVRQEISIHVKTLATDVFKAIALIEPTSTRSLSTTLYEIQSIKSTINMGEIVTSLLKPNNEVSRNQDLRRQAFVSMTEIFNDIFDAIKYQAAVAVGTLSHVDPSLKLRAIAGVRALAEALYASSKDQAYYYSGNAQ